MCTCWNIKNEGNLRVRLRICEKFCNFAPKFENIILLSL